MDDWVRVIRSEDLPAATPEHPGIRRLVAGETAMLLARLDTGEVVAFDTVCPHQLTDLEEAYFWDGNLRCPRHQYLYDPRTGQNILPTREARPENLWKLKPGYLPTYSVEERDGWVWVDASPRPPPPGYDPERERRPPASADAGGSPSDPSPGSIEHPTRTLRVREGAFFELRLPTSPRPGFTWNVEVTGDVTVTEEGWLAGATPRHRVRLLACLEGEAAIRCAYARPWDDQPAEVRTYVVRVVAEG